MFLARLTWPEVDALDRETPVVIPTAALVQGGRHLAIGAYYLCLDEMVRRLEEERPKALFLPTLSIGNSDLHTAFVGTISHSYESYGGVLRDTVESLTQHGFRRFLFLIGDRSSEVSATVALRRVKRDHPTLRIAAVGLDREMGHAGKFATALAMAVDPTLVRTDQIRDDGLVTFPWALSSMEESTETGVWGEPTQMTKTHVERALSYVNNLVSTLDSLAGDEPLIEAIAIENEKLLGHSRNSVSQELSED